LSREAKHDERQKGENGTPRQTKTAHERGTNKARPAKVKQQREHTPKNKGRRKHHITLLFHAPASLFFLCFFSALSLPFLRFSFSVPSPLLLCSFSASSLLLLLLLCSFYSSLYAILVFWIF